MSATAIKPHPPVDVAAVSVVVVDDDRDSSYSMWALLRWLPGIQVLARSGSEHAADVIAEVRPDACLVSAANGPRLVQALARLPDAPHVLAYAAQRTPELAATARVAGAEAVLWRYGDPVELAASVRQAVSRGSS